MELEIRQEIQEYKKSRFEYAPRIGLICAAAGLLLESQALIYSGVGFAGLGYIATMIEENKLNRN